MPTQVGGLCPLGYNYWNVSLVDKGSHCWMPSKQMSVALLQGTHRALWLMTGPASAGTKLTT